MRLESSPSKRPSKSSPPPSLGLESLEICGVDPASVLQGTFGLQIDFKQVRILKIESCSRLNDALTLFHNGNGTPKSIEMPKITELSIRHEQNVIQLDFQLNLRLFLVSLPGLTRLEVLVENIYDAQNLRPILEKHGNALQHLLWDERRGPGAGMRNANSILPEDRRGTANVELISRTCPNLVALALPFNWDPIISKSGYQMVKFIHIWSV